MLKKFRNKVRGTVNGAVIKGQSILACKKGEGYVDTGVKILIAVPSIDAALDSDDNIVFAVNPSRIIRNKIIGNVIFRVASI